MFCLLCSVFWLAGCAEPETKTKTQYLIQTQILHISSMGFSQELELKKSAYPYDIKKNPNEYNGMVISLVKMLSEEIVLLSAAADKQIFVTDQEVLLAQKEFKKDYSKDSFEPNSLELNSLEPDSLDQDNFEPDSFESDSFESDSSEPDRLEQILLENAISYSFWEKRFKKNMIMEKLIDQELKQKLEITPQDIVQFYKTYNKLAIDSENNPTVLNEIADEKELNEKDLNEKELNEKELNEKELNEKDLISRLRMQKTQEKYYEWIQNLYQAYPVEINKDKLKNFLIDIKDKEDENAKEN